MKQLVRVCGPKDRPGGKEAFVINVTSGSGTWCKVFSPFFLGPVTLASGDVAANVENAWQFSKLYPRHADEHGNPTADYWRWARNGWADEFAHRYPMGPGAKPLCAIRGTQKLNYVNSRKQIYVPLYRTAVLESGYFESLVEFCAELIAEGQTPYLFDFDGYDNVFCKRTLDQVLNNPHRKMGHAFVLAQMLHEALVDHPYLKEKS